MGRPWTSIALLAAGTLLESAAFLYSPSGIPSQAISLTKTRWAVSGAISENIGAVSRREAVATKRTWPGRCSRSAGGCVVPLMMAKRPKTGKGKGKKKEERTELIGRCAEQERVRTLAANTQNTNTINTACVCIKLLYVMMYTAVIRLGPNRVRVFICLRTVYCSSTRNANIMVI